MEQVLERTVTGCYDRLRHLSISEMNPLTQPTTEHVAYIMRDYSKNELATRRYSREKRLACYIKVHQLHQAGRSISQISRELNLNRTTVRRYAYAGHFPNGSNARLVAASWALICHT